MSYLVSMALLAAAAKHNQSRRHNQSGRNNSIKAHKHIYSYDGETHNYIDCVFQELKDKDSTLYEFFKKLNIEYLKEKEVENKVIEDEINKLEAQAKTITPNYDKISSIMNSKGITFKHEFYSCNVNYEPFMNICDRKIFISNNDANSIIKEFEDYIKARKLSIEVEEKSIEETKNSIAKEERRLKFSIFKRKEIEKNINHLKRDLKKFVNSRNSLIEGLSQYEEFVSMSLEEKELFDKSLPELLQLFELKKEIYDLYSKRSKIQDEMKYNFDKETMTRVFERMIEEGNIDQKTLEIVFLMLDKVEIKARRGEYSFQNTYHSRTFDSIVKWFISDVYEMDPNFVDRNYILPEEEVHVKKLVQ